MPDDTVAASADTTADDVAGRVEAVFEAHHVKLLRLARTLTVDHVAGEDLVQEVFVRALRHCRRDPAYLREPVWPWLRVTLVRAGLDRRRQAVRELRRLVRMYQPPAEAAWGESVDLARALARLPRRMRTCVVLRYGEDLPIEEVAATMGCSEATAKSQLWAARRRLRAAMADVSGDTPPHRGEHDA